MEWKLLNKDGEFIQEVNCEYDSCDISRWEHRATKITLDFKNKCAYIIETEDDINE